MTGRTSWAAPEKYVALFCLAAWVTPIVSRRDLNPT